MIISIQSQVIHGHVGNSAAVFPMQHLGIPVAAVPTTLLSNHPHYPTMRGRVLEADFVKDLLLGVEERGLVDACAAVVTGYLGSVANGEAVADFVERAKRRNPELRYCCDPVLGDVGVGMYVETGLQALFRERLLPIADIVTPNEFEVRALLPGRPETISPSEAAAALLEIGSRTVVVTGVGLADPSAARVDTFAVEESSAWRVATPRLPCRPAGTGDLFTSFFIAHLVQNADTKRALECAVSEVFAVLTNTAASGAPEMLLVETLSGPRSSKHRFSAARLSDATAPVSKKALY